MLNILKRKDDYLHGTGSAMKQEIESCLKEIENYVKVYEAATLLSSFHEEVKLFNNRVIISPKKYHIKNLLIKNQVDTDENLRNEFDIILNNYKIIHSALDNYPLWQEKFENDSIKLLAFANNNYGLPQITQIVQQQKIFR